MWARSQPGSSTGGVAGKLKEKLYIKIEQYMSLPELARDRVLDVSCLFPSNFPSHFRSNLPSVFRACFRGTARPKIPSVFAAILQFFPTCNGTLTSPLTSQNSIDISTIVVEQYSHNCIIELCPTSRVRRIR